MGNWFEFLILNDLILYAASLLSRDTAKLKEKIVLGIKYSTYFDKNKTQEVLVVLVSCVTKCMWVNHQMSVSGGQIGRGDDQGVVLRLTITPITRGHLHTFT